MGPGDEKLLGRASGWKITPTGAKKIWEHTSEEKVGFVSGEMSGLPMWKDWAFIRNKSGTTLLDVNTGKVLARCPEAKTDQESHGYCAEGRFFHEPDSQHGSVHDVLMLGTTAGTFKPMGRHSAVRRRILDPLWHEQDAVAVLRKHQIRLSFERCLRVMTPAPASQRDGCPRSARRERPRVPIWCEARHKLWSPRPWPIGHICPWHPCAD